MHIRITIRARSATAASFAVLDARRIAGVTDEFVITESRGDTFWFESPCYGVAEAKAVERQMITASKLLFYWDRPLPCFGVSARNAAAGVDQ